MSETMLTMTKREDTFEYAGKTYVPGPITYAHSCLGCAFDHNYKACFKAPSCSGLRREDGQDIVWVEDTGEKPA